MYIIDNAFYIDNEISQFCFLDCKWGMSLWDTLNSARQFAENAVDALAADSDEEDGEEEVRDEPKDSQEKSSSKSFLSLSDATNVLNKVADIILPEEEDEEEEEEEAKNQSDEAELFRIQARQLADELRKSMERNKELEARILEASKKTNSVSELKAQNEMLQEQLQSRKPEIKRLEIELEKKSVEKLKTLEIELERNGAALQSDNVQDQESISELKSLNMRLREQLESKDPEIKRLESELQKSFERTSDEIEAERRASLDTHHREQAKMNARMKQLLKKYHDLEQEKKTAMLESREAMSNMERKFESYVVFTHNTNVSYSLTQPHRLETQHEASLRNFQRDLKQAQDLADTNESDATHELMSRLNMSNEKASQVQNAFTNYETRVEIEIQDLKNEASIRIDEMSERSSKLRDEYVRSYNTLQPYHHNNNTRTQIRELSEIT